MGGVFGVANSATFAWVCEALERLTSLDRLEARGTVRIALKQSGLDVHTVTVRQMDVVIDRILPDELEARGIDDALALCGALRRDMKNAGIRDAQLHARSPDEVFRRLGGGS